MAQHNPKPADIANRAGGPLSLVPLALILALLAYQVWTGYETAKREAQTTVDNLADILTLTVKSALDRLRSDLADFSADVTADELNRPMNPARRAQLEQRMAAALGGFDAVLHYRAFNAHGDTVLGVGRINPQAQFNVADRDWFQALQANPSHPFVISEVLISKATGQPGFFLAQPIRDSQGNFGGSVNAHINLDWFQMIIDNLDIGAEGLVTLRHRTASRLLLRRPKVEREINESNSGLYHLHTSTTQRASGEFESAIDHVRRVYAFRGMSPYPLTVVVAISPADFLQSWKTQAVVTMFVALLLSAIQVLVYRRLTQAYRATVAMATELQAINVNLQRSNAELEEFAYIASHDLQTPLRNITSFSQLLLRRFGDQLEGDGHEFLDFIVTNAQRMSSLIRDLLAYARLSRQCQSPQIVSARTVLDQVLMDLATTIADSGARIAVSDLPELRINEYQLSSLLLNLLNNAIKYRHPDRPPEITVSAEPAEHGLWLLAISDNGIGIEPEYWEKIFAIFQRLHTPDQYEGDGIGLALCRRIVHHWGGTIWVTSKPGLGSTFYFTLPAA